MRLHRHVITRSLAPLLVGCLVALPAIAVDVVIMQDDLIQFTEQAFMQNVFGNHHTYAAAREHSEKALQIQIEYVENAVDLSDQQKRKLELAGHGDIHRFFTDFEAVKRGMEFGGIPRDEWQEVWQRTQPLATRFAAGLHGPRSLLTKAIASTLGPEQRESFDAMRRERDVAIYIDNIRMTLSLIDRKVPLTREQRETITQMLVRTTEPPRFYGQSSMHFYVILIQMANLPRERLQAVFSDVEWKVIDGLLRQAKGMEPTVQRQLDELGQ